jgi:hypothetical protein
MTIQRKQFLVGSIAIVAVAIILSVAEVGANGNTNGNAKGKIWPKPATCEPCTDACETDPDPSLVGLCYETLQGESTQATRACCCCGDNPQGHYWRSGFSK